MSEATVRVDTLMHVVHTCAMEFGDTPATFAARARVEWTSLQSSTRVSTAVLHRLWHTAASAPRALSAVVGTSLPLERLGPYGFALLTAPSGLSALRVAARAYPLINELARWQVYESNAQVNFRFDGESAGSAGVAASREAMVGYVVAGLRRLVGTSPRRVAFAHRRPRYAHDLTSRLDCRVDWDTGTTEVELDRAPLDAPPPFADKTMSALLHAHLESELAALVSSGRFSLRVARLLSTQLEDRLDAKQLAAQLRISERSLRRRLADEGTSLRKLRDTARMERAQALLLDESQTVSAVATQVGFADGSSLARAFRRKQGTAPRR